MRDQETIRAVSAALLMLGVFILILTLVSAYSFVYAVGACLSMIGLGAALHFSIKP